MILIDEAAEKKLATMLEVAKTDFSNMRCIGFLLSGKPPVPEMREKIITAARKHLAYFNIHIYLCGDGDIFILAPSIAAKEGRDFILEVASHTDLPVDDSWVIFNDLHIINNRISSLLADKLKKINQHAEAQKAQLQQKLLEKKRQNILNGEISKNHADISKKRSTRPAPELMIIEDDVFSLRLVEKVISKEYRMVAVSESEHALTTYADHAPDMLFLDINLPDVNGHELLERIMSMDPNAYVVMLSGNSDRENIMQAMSLGAKGFIAKPFTRDKLFQYINQCPTIKQPEK